MRDVIEQAAALGIPVEFTGSGIARAQVPEPGAILPSGTIGTRAIWPLSEAAMTLEEILQGVRLRTGAAGGFAESAGDGIGIRLATGASRDSCSLRFRARAPMAASSRRQAMEKGAVAVVSELPAPAGFPGPGSKWSMAGRRWRWPRGIFMASRTSG